MYACIDTAYKFSLTAFFNRFMYALRVFVENRRSAVLSYSCCSIVQHC
jgi:hypothetical protein